MHHPLLFIDSIKAVVTSEPIGKVICAVIDFSPSDATGGWLVIEQFSEEVVIEPKRLPFKLGDINAEFLTGFLRTLAPNCSKMQLAQARTLLLDAKNKRRLVVIRSVLGRHNLDIRTQ